ncbi:stalk domain-containing protein [Paenibacillus sp. HB172176]|uniref:stalk domain-containing protein n=1 Tax=Paenibacillus sp. HB172176 TaxID=2493690 RepID=UPI001F0F8ECA|nr:stalk domain-containing protein [Paenibacillus sp. HB172176]
MSTGRNNIGRQKESLEKKSREMNGRMKSPAKENGWQTNSLGKKVAAVTISGIILAQPVVSIMPASWHAQVIAQASAASSDASATATTTAATTATESQLKLVNQSIITAGAKRLEYVWDTVRNKKQVQTAVHVIEVDLTNPYVSLNAMSGKNDSIGQKNNVLNMVKENGAVAGINSDVFVMSGEGAPLGAQIISGTLMSSPAKLKGMYAFALTADRKPLIDAYTFTGAVTAQNGQVFPLEGLNESAYNPEVDGVSYSHVNTMYIYTSAWGGAQRPMNSATTPTEALVIDGIVAQISVGAALDTVIPENGYILRAHGTAAKFITDNLQVGQPVVSDYSLVSQTTGQPIEADQLSMLIGGHTLLINNGAASAFTRDVAGVSGTSYTSRSGIGFSKDGTKVYMITSEKSGSNTGLSLKELQQIMLKLGIYKGMNFDGGGSTTMVERPLGSTSVQLAHPNQDVSQRNVANGIGVFTTAPQGALKGLIPVGSQVLFQGQTASYSVTGYDTYYNPFALDKEQTVWSASGDVGKFEGNTFTASKVGKTQITVQNGAVKQSYDVEVIGRDQIASMSIKASPGLLTEGTTLKAPISVKLNNGKTYSLSGDLVSWEFLGFEGSYKDGVITVGKVEKDAKLGYAIARYDGYGAMIPFVSDEKATSVEDFEVSRYAITAQVTPEGTTQGSVKLVSDLPQQKNGRALQLSYDFTNSSGTSASYAVFGSGRTLSGSPSFLSMDVFSDNSNNWMRAEVIDANGKVHLLDITKQLNWSGWKNIQVDLAADSIAFPAKLTRIYVVTLDQDFTKKAASGAVAMDNLVLHAPTVVPEPAKAKVIMTIGKQQATIDGKAATLEAAPILQNNSTYVPLRFVTEAMGAQVFYNDALRKVTVIRGDDLLEMTIGEKAYTLNGMSYTSDVAPFIRNNRTLIPVRLFSEKLGFEVDYEDKLRKITID